MWFLVYTSMHVTYVYEQSSWMVMLVYSIHYGYVIVCVN